MSSAGEDASDRLTTTFRLLKQHGVCGSDTDPISDRYAVLAEALGGVEEYGYDTPIPLTRILDINGLDDCLWAFCAVPDDQRKARDRMNRLLAADFAEHVAHSAGEHEGVCRETIAVARRYADGQATEDELTTSAASAAVWAARSAVWAAAAAARAGAAARAAAWARAAEDPDAERAWQANRTREYLEGKV